MHQAVRPWCYHGSEAAAFYGSRQQVRQRLWQAQLTAPLAAADLRSFFLNEYFVAILPQIES